MTLSAAGFPGTVTDIQWSKLIDLVGNEGVIGMTVTAATGDRRVQIGTGRANVGGILFEVTAAETLTLGANISGQTRIDLIVAEATWGDKQIRLKALPGTPGATPIVPTATRLPGDTYQVPLARVTVASGQGSLGSGDITIVSPPPAADFYNISGINTAPDASLGALIWYRSAESLRVPINGVYTEIATARRKIFQVESGTQILAGFGPSYTPGAAVCGMSFTAIADHAKITVAGYIRSNLNGNQCVLSFELRRGGTIGAGGVELGPHTTRGILTGEAVNTGSPSYLSASNDYLITGLTPGNTYNVRTMHWAATSNAGSILWRRLLVEV